MMKFEEIIRQISEEYTQAWNEWDIERILNCMANGARLYSPYISFIYPENTQNVIEGKQNIREYWLLLIEKIGAFKVVQTSFLKEDRKVTTLNTVIGKPVTIKEIFTINEYGKIDELTYEYLNIQSV